MSDGAARWPDTADPGGEAHPTAPAAFSGLHPTTTLFAQGRSTKKKKNTCTRFQDGAVNDSAVS